MFPITNPDGSVSPKKFILKALINHVGTLGNGHYTAIVKDCTCNIWSHCNDRAVIPFRQRKCFQKCFSLSGFLRGSTNSTQLSLCLATAPQLLLLLYSCVFYFWVFYFFFNFLSFHFMCGNAECWGPVTL